MKLAIPITMIVTLSLAMTGCGLQDYVDEYEREQLEQEPDFLDDEHSTSEFRFRDISDSCKIHYDVDPATKQSPCGDGEKHMSIFETKIGVWSVLCCNRTLDGDYDKICPGTKYDKYNGFVMSDENIMAGHCCDVEGDNCYLDLRKNNNDTEKLCDTNYPLGTSLIRYDAYGFDSLCEVEGEEV